MERTLYRSRSDRMIAGVCGGIAEYFSLDPTLVRVGVVLLGIVTQGGIGIAYLVMAIIVPEEPVGTGVPTNVSEQGGVLVSDTNEPKDSGIPSAPEVVPPPQSVSEPANAPSVTPATHSWTPPAPVEHEHRGGVGFGVALILIGGLLLANQFLPGIDLWRFWPLIIIAVGISALIKGARR
ncbi:MAG: PspC domain-containing protein [Actinobacteria bacterium]|nr:MAG: PspC domain-containing protein [Actinomycetota bacterium]